MFETEFSLVKTELIPIWTENFILFFYLLQCLIVFGKQQRVPQLLKVGYRICVYRAIFPAHTQTNQCSTERERQTTEKKHTDIRMDFTHDQKKEERRWIPTFPDCF